MAPRDLPSTKGRRLLMTSSPLTTRDGQVKLSHRRTKRVDFNQSFDQPVLRRQRVAFSGVDHDLSEREKRTAPT